MFLANPFVKAVPHDYFNLVNYKDLLLVIAQLRDHVRELLGDLARCQDQSGQLILDQAPGPLFWLLVAIVAFSARTPRRLLHRGPVRFPTHLLPDYSTQCCDQI